MDPRRAVRVSKYLSKHLRHQPERLGLRLQPGGWVDVDELLAACERHAFALTEDELRAVVAGSDKQRFAFGAGGTRIRANQGHSVPIDLQLAPAMPPARLFHGTGRGAVDAILADGLRSMGRHHVHLSPDAATAIAVGRRHGRPVVFEVAAGRMAAADHPFFVSANGVWLTDHVPPDCLARLTVGVPVNHRQCGNSA